MSRRSAAAASSTSSCRAGITSSFWKPSGSGAPATRCILLCEDDPDAAAVLAGRLRAAGFATDVACTAEEAVKGAATRSYAAILVDLQLPDSDGISLIKNLRAQPRYHNTPIVVVSADPKRGRDDRRSSTLNVLDWLEKPVDTERFLHVLRLRLDAEPHHGRGSRHQRPPPRTA